MDKYSVYVIVVYVVTLVLLGAYLGWLWLRLRATQDEPELSAEAVPSRNAGQRR